MPDVDIIKNNKKRRTEPYTTEKLRQSIIATCLSIRRPKGEAEKTADLVAKKVEHWLASRPTVTSQDIRRIASEALSEYNPEAAYLYKQHQTIL